MSIASILIICAVVLLALSAVGVRSNVNLQTAAFACLAASLLF